MSCSITHLRRSGSRDSIARLDESPESYSILFLVSHLTWRSSFFTNPENHSQYYHNGENVRLSSRHKRDEIRIIKCSWPLHGVWFDGMAHASNINAILYGLVGVSARAISSESCLSWSYMSRTSAWNPLIWFGISDTLAVLTILSSVLSTITVMLLFESFDMIGWMLAKRDSGVKTIRLLGISSMTGVTGASGLIFSKHTTVVDKILIAAKLLLLAGSWVSGLLLFAKTSITSVNNTISTYNVTAGIGSFRGAFVPEFLQQLQNTNAGYDKTVLPYSIITTASQLTINSRYAVTTKPVGCDSPRDCNSYLFPGALMQATPFPPTDNEDYPTITIHNAPATQLDFRRIYESEQTFNEAEDCRTFGADGFLVGMKFCLAEMETQSNSLLAGKQRSLSFLPKQPTDSQSSSLRLPSRRDRWPVHPSRSQHSPLQHHDHPESLQAISHRHLLTQQLIHNLHPIPLRTHAASQPRSTRPTPSFQLALQLHRRWRPGPLISRPILLVRARPARLRILVHGSLPAIHEPALLPLLAL